MKEHQFLTLPGSMTAVSFQPPQRLTWEECRTIGLRLAQFKHFLKFAMGDLLVYAETHFGERYVQLAAEMGLSSQEAYGLHYVCTRVEPSRREKSLFWSHHKEVAKLSAREQTKWLARAAKDRWTIGKLIDELESGGLRKAPRKSKLIEKPKTKTTWGKIEQVVDDMGAKEILDKESVAAVKEFAESPVTCHCCTHAADIKIPLCNACLDDLLTVTEALGKTKAKEKEDGPTEN